MPKYKALRMAHTDVASVQNPFAESFRRIDRTIERLRRALRRKNKLAVSLSQKLRTESIGLIVTQIVENLWDIGTSIFFGRPSSEAR